MKKILLIGLFGLLLALPSVAQSGPKWDLGDDSWIKLSFLGQVHYSFMDEAADQDDFYLRRGRIILAGQIMDGVKFFMETDNDNAGKHEVDASTDIQDVFVDLRLGDSDHWVKAGLIFLPFSFESHSSAVSLLGIDYNSETIKLINAFVWRDYGVELHGNFGKRFAYNIGAFDGYPVTNKNPEAPLRYTGHLAFNLVGDVETRWFNTQDRLGKGNYLTVGAGFDNQDKATLDTVEVDSSAWVVDFQSGFVLGRTDLTINGAYYDWDNANFEGSTAFIEAGLRVNNIMLSLKYSNQDREDFDEINDYTLGIHYFLKNHNVRGGIEYRTGDSSDWTLVGVQFFI